MAPDGPGEQLTGPGPGDGVRPGISARADLLSEEAVQAIVERAPDGIVMVDARGMMVLVNRRVEEMFGYGPGELLGRSIEVLVPEELRAAHARHRERYREEPHVRPMGSGLELTGVRRDGTTVPIEVSLCPVNAAGGHHALAMIRDVTERKENEESVRRLQRLLDTSTEAVFLAHAETLELVYVNEGAVALTGHDRRALLAMSPLDLVEVADEEAVREVLGRLRPGGGSTRQEMRLVRADGSAVDCDVLVQCFEWAGRRWLAAFVRDLTDRLRAEEQQRRAEQALALVEQQERIARDLHDTVIQSLFGIGMSLQAASMLAGGGAVSERLDRAVEDLDRAIRGLRATVFSLHEPSPVVGGLRRQVAATVQEVSRSLGFTPAVRFAGPVDYIVPDDVLDQLVPCLREALANVAKHAGARHVEVEVSVGEAIVLSVADDGVGLRADARRGEGLNNLEARAAALGGACVVARRPEGGTVVVWSVPATGTARAVDTSEAPATATPPAPPCPAPAGRRQGASRSGTMGPAGAEDLEDQP